MRARQLVYDALAELNITDLGTCCETVLVRDGFCVGRRFSFASAQAVWWEAGAKTEIYDGQGRLCRTISADGQAPLRKAA
jgi:hypothetical protein